MQTLLARLTEVIQADPDAAASEPLNKILCLIKQVRADPPDLGNPTGYRNAVAQMADLTAALYGDKAIEMAGQIPGRHPRTFVRSVIQHLEKRRRG